MYIEKIKNPSDLKKIKKEELQTVADELREALLFRLSKVGGHNGPNLGVVEMTVALHYVFESPVDKIVYDVSHQSYIHKMLTGRLENYINEEKFKDISGYTNPHESEHDFFEIGHTSTSVSLATGLAVARDLKKEPGNIIAVLGDGSVSGGLALEGLNNAGNLTSNLIVIINDNDMSISENSGGLYKNLKELRENNGVAETNLFTAMGLDYHFIQDGHDIEAMITKFSEVKDSKKPVAIHIHTIKGKGFKAAELNKEKYHAGPAIDLATGDYVKKRNQPTETYQKIYSEALYDKMKKDPLVSVLTAGTPSIYNYDAELRKELGNQFIDTGIAEEQAVTMASAMASNGAKPVFTVFSTFIQRAYDQLSHDLAINDNSAVIQVIGGGLSAFNDVTHLGFFDIPLISNIPNIVFLAPATKEEYTAMLNWGIEQTEHPVVIRIPGGLVVSSGVEDKTNYSELNKSELVKKGENIVVYGLGNLQKVALEAQSELEEKHDVKISVVNPKFISGIDQELADDLKQSHNHFITLEDGQVEGGFGQKLASYLGNSEVKVTNLGLDKEFIDRFDPQVTYAKNILTKETLIDFILKNN